MVLKLSICTSALQLRQQSEQGLRVTQIAYFSLRRHTKQLLLGTFCYTTAGIGANFRKNTQTDGRTAAAEGQTDVEVVSYLDMM